VQKKPRAAGEFELKGVNICSTKIMTDFQNSFVTSFSRKFSAASL